MQNISRRDFVRTCALGTAFLASGAIVSRASVSGPQSNGPANLELPMDHDWLFGGKYQDGADQPGYNDLRFSRVTLPHCVAKLSWEKWDPASWQDIWVYRRHFHVPKEFRNRRLFIHFDRVMTSAKPNINGHTLPEHLGGYLPFHHEITDLVNDSDNVLSVVVNAKWQPVPPDGNPKGTAHVDYLEAGGIPGSVTLRALPQIFISDVFAKPVNVLSPERTVEIACSLDAAMRTDKPLEVSVEMLDGNKRIATVSQPVTLDKTGIVEVKLTLSSLGNVKLWESDAPQLYSIRTTLLMDGQPLHEHRTRIGLREAKFTPDGFFLNGKRVRLFGLNRHEIYPYVGFAMPPRVMRRDAEILRHEFNCNVVRCSHYPQSPAFLDACDELGLMVWEEIPGWHYIGNQAWQDLAVRDVQDMVRRDRNRPSVIIWGVRINESANIPDFYTRTTAAAKALDDTRPASGAMDRYGLKGWSEDVYAFNDYTQDEKTGKIKLKEPLPGVPFLLTETVGQLVGPGPSIAHKYRRAGDLALQLKQAIYHAQAHDQVAANPRFCGAIAWCAFDYASGENPYNQIKSPGVADVFRIPKLGATFYQSQVSPDVQPVIEPNFYWDFGWQTPNGPGKNVAIFSNCDRLEIFVGGKKTATVTPDSANYPHIKYPPFFCDLEIENPDSGSRKKNTPPPGLRIDGYVGDNLALSRTFSADLSKDKFTLVADDDTLIADGSDATRVVFRVTDQFGAQRPFCNGGVVFHLDGPGIIVGDNPFTLLDDSGGVGAVWVKTLPNKTGRIALRAMYSSWNGEAQWSDERRVAIDVVPDPDQNAQA